MVKVTNNVLTVKTLKGNIDVKLSGKMELTENDLKAAVADLMTGARVVVDIPEGSKDNPGSLRQNRRGEQDCRSARERSAQVKRALTNCASRATGRGKLPFGEQFYLAVAGSSGVSK